MLTDTKSSNMRLALHQIYVNLYVEYGWSSVISAFSSVAAYSYLVVVKNPLSPIEHPGGLGVNNELFEESLEQFVVRFESDCALPVFSAPLFRVSV